MRAVRVPFSPARPSRLKKLPGILPAAYMRSSTSTVSGRKSTSRRFPAVAVARTIVSPARTTTAPLACLASLPVSNVISVPPISTETRALTSFICSFQAASGWRHVSLALSERVLREASSGWQTPMDGSRRSRRWSSFSVPARGARRPPRASAAAQHPGALTCARETCPRWSPSMATTVAACATSGACATPAGRVS